MANQTCTHTLRSSHDGLPPQDGQGDPLAALGDVLLLEEERAVLADEVGEHAGEDAAIVPCSNEKGQNAMKGERVRLFR
jgi:hypothetical protein